VSPTPTQTFTPTFTFSPTATFTNTPTPTPTSVPAAQLSSYTYDGDGKLVKAVEDGVTTIYVGAHYQLSGGVVTKYYFAGTQRIAQRTGGTLSFILADHLGSTGVVTDAAGTVIAEVRYTPYGETRVASGTSPRKSIGDKPHRLPLHLPAAGSRAGIILLQCQVV
jgi:uncharacterized protein RhaS with RHS repeats